MPQFDVYQSKGTRSADVGATPKSYQEVETLDQAGQQSAQTVDYIAKAWQEAEDFAQTSTASNNLLAQSLAFEEDLSTLDIQAGSDGDYYKVYNQKKKDYESKIESIKNNQSTISNPEARQAFKQQVDKTYSVGKIKLDAAFREKAIQHQKVELIRNGDIMKKLFTRGNDDAKAQYTDMINRNYERGFIDEGEKLKLDESVKSWDSTRILKTAEIDPKLAFEMTNDSDLDPEEKASLLGNIKQIQASKEIEAEVKQAETFSQNREELSNMLVGADSYADKKDALDNALYYGDIDEKSYNNMFKALVSTNKVDAKTNIKAKSELLSEIVMFGSEYTTEFIKRDFRNTRDYFKGQEKIQAKILDAFEKGKLSTSDYQDLLEESSTKNSYPAKQGAGTQAMKEEINYSKTFDDISKNIGGEDARSNAIDEYYRVAKEVATKTDVKAKDFKDLKNQIIRKYKYLQLQTTKSDPNREQAIKDLKERGISTSEANVSYLLAKRQKGSLK